MRRAAVRGFALGLITGTFLTASVVLFAQPAKADPNIAAGERVVCLLLDSNPTFQGIIQAAAVIEQKTGVDDRTAGQMIAASVYDQCPEYIPLITAFVQKYGGAQTKVTGNRIGGRVA